MFFCLIYMFITNLLPMKKPLLSFCILFALSLTAFGQTNVCVNTYVFTEAFILDSMTVDPNGNSDIDDWDVFHNGQQIYEGHYDPSYSFYVGWFNWQNPAFLRLSYLEYFAPGDTLTQVITTSSGTTSECAVLYLTPAPAVSLDIEDVICMGDDNGSIAVVPTGNSQPYTYMWNTNQMDSSISTLSAGTYTVTVTDANNVSVPFTIDLDEPSQALALVVSNVVFASCFSCADGAIVLSATGGEPVYDYTCNGGTCTGLVPDVYDICVTDIRGCQDCSTVQVNFATSANLVRNDQFKLSPNPATDRVELNFTQQLKGDIIIYNQTGQIVYQEAFNSAKQQVDVSQLPAGLYLLNVKGEDYTIIEKLVISR